MLKDHVDFDALQEKLRAFVRGDGPKPPDIATWRKARAGERCGGCGEEFREGSLVQEALSDQSIGHAECHLGMPRGAGVRIQNGRTFKGVN